MASPSEGSSSTPLRFILNVLAKSCLLFIILNLGFALLQPIPILERISGYNWIFPGRVRLPFGENQEKAYNLSLYQLDAMMNSHEVALLPKPDEYRVFIVGDSSVWGFLLQPGQTLSAMLNDLPFVTQDGKQVRYYNLGYPTMSLTKDLLVLSKAMRYKPDLIIWLLTLESFPVTKQLDSPIVQNNPKTVQVLISTYHLHLDPEDPAFTRLSFLDQTIFGRRRALADLIRLQVYGVLWAATGVDQYYPDSYDPPQKDLSADETFHSLTPPHLLEKDLAFDVLQGGMQMAGDIPLLIVNEPIFVSQGENSNIRYNFFYPRWAFDDYLQMIAEKSQQSGWNYLDVWDLVPSSEFTNSAIHLTPVGSAMLAREVQAKVKDILQVK